MTLALGQSETTQLDSLLQDARKKLEEVLQVVAAACGAGTGQMISISGLPRTSKDDFDLYNDIWDSLGKLRRAQSKLP
jgi:hypothetical protein